MYNHIRMIAPIVCVLIIIVIVACLIIFSKSKHPKKVIVRSRNDDRDYVVQNTPGVVSAVETLSEVRKNIMTLADYLYKHKDEYPEFAEYIDRLNDKIRDTKLSENLPGSKHTSYTINKGSEIALCLRNYPEFKKLHDINTIMYVAIHEISHVACPEINHTELFKKIFAFFLSVATQLNIYEHSHYDINPEKYCGIIINENLLD